MAYNAQLRQQVANDLRTLRNEGFTPPQRRRLLSAKQSNPEVHEGDQMQHRLEFALWLKTHGKLNEGETPS